MEFIIKYAAKLAIQLGITALIGWAANKVAKRNSSEQPAENNTPTDKLPEKDVNDEKVT